MRQQYYDNNRIKISRRKRDRDDDDDSNSNVTAAFITPSKSNTKVPARSNITSADKADLLESNKQLEQKLREEIGDYWDSKDARNVFNPNEGEAVVAAIDRRIGLLEEMQNDEALFLKHKCGGEFEPSISHQRPEIRSKDSSPHAYLPIL